MSIQDDIFDVQHALECKPEAEAFERIYTALADLEREVYNLQRFRNSITDAARQIRMELQR